MRKNEEEARKSRAVRSECKSCPSEGERAGKLGGNVLDCHESKEYSRRPFRSWSQSQP